MGNGSSWTNGYLKLCTQNNKLSEKELSKLVPLTLKLKKHFILLNELFIYRFAWALDVYL